MSIVAVSSKRSVDLRVTRLAGAVADEYVAIAEYSSATCYISNKYTFFGVNIPVKVSLCRANSYFFIEKNKITSCIIVVRSFIILILYTNGIIK